MPESQPFFHLRDTFGNVPMVKRYTLLSLFFRTESGRSPSDIEAALRHGLDRLAEYVPHLAGHVTFEGRVESSWGRATIYPLHEPISLTINDVRETREFPPMDELLSTGVATSVLDPGLLVPQHALPLNYTSGTQYRESEARPARVLALQATLIPGGTILTFASNHTTMDMNGLGQVIVLFAKCCRGEDLSQVEIEGANAPREGLVPLIENYTPGAEAEYFTYSPSPPKDPAETPKPESSARWTTIIIPAASLARLKQAATPDANTTPSVPYISTNDAVTALLWRSLSRAHSHLPKDTVSEAHRVTSARTLLNLPATYGGHMTASNHTHLSSPHLLPLSTVAAHLRSTLRDTAKMAYEIRALATTLTSLAAEGKDTQHIGYGMNLDLTKDVVFSSYAEIGVVKADFGSVLGGRPICARRPGIDPAPSCANVMPLDRDGGCCVLFGLREEDEKTMKQDTELGEWVTWVD